MAVNAALIGARGTSATTTVTTTAGTSTGGSGSIGVLVCSFDPGTTNNTPSDSKSNTWTIIGAVVTGIGKTVWYKSENWTGGASHTATMTFAANAFPTLHLIEVTGAATTTPQDINVSGVPTASPYTISSGTLAQANEVLIASLEQNVGSAGNYSSSNFTILSDEPDVVNFWTSGVGKLVVASTSSVTPSFTRANSTNGNSGMRVVSFKEAGGAPDTLVGQACL